MCSFKTGTTIESIYFDVIVWYLRPILYFSAGFWNFHHFPVGMNAICQQVKVGTSKLGYIIMKCFDKNVFFYEYFLEIFNRLFKCQQATALWQHKNDPTKWGPHSMWAIVILLLYKFWFRFCIQQKCGIIILYNSCNFGNEKLVLLLCVSFYWHLTLDDTINYRFLFFVYKIVETHASAKINEEMIKRIFTSVLSSMYQALIN